MSKVHDANTGKAAVTPGFEVNENGSPFFKHHLCCKDFFMIIVFGVFFTGLVLIWGLADARGDVRRVLYPVDLNGDLCGIDNGGEANDFSDRPFLAWYNPQDPESEICVRACRSNYQELEVANFNAQHFDASEIYDPDASRSTRYPRYDDVSVFRRCLPRDLSNLPDYFNNLVGPTTTLFSDVSKGWWVILLFGLASIVLCFIYLLVMKHFALEMLRATVVLLILLILVAAGLFLAKGADKLPESFAEQHSALERDLSEHEKNVALAIGVGLVIFDIILMFIACWFHNTIGIVGQMIEEASRVLSDVPSLVFLPWSIMTAKVGWAVLWLYFTIVLWTCGTIDQSVEPTFGKNGFHVGDFDGVTKLALVYHFFAFIWVLMVISGLTRLTIGGVATTWYFTRDHNEEENPSKADQMPNFLVVKSFYRSVRHNFGSAVMGGLVLTIVFCVKWFFRILQFVVNRNKERTNACLVFVVSCLTCIVNCIAKIVETVSKFAYVEVALYNVSFITGAKRTMENVIKANLDKVAFVDTIGDLMLFLFKLLVAVVTAGLYNLTITSSAYQTKYAPQNVNGLTFLVAGIAYLVANSFFNVLETTIDSFLLCFCEDIASNKEGSRYMRKSLQKFLEENPTANLMQGERS